jgi:hypothetical protein
MLALPAAARRALGHDQAAALAVNLDDLDRDHLPDVGGQLSLAILRRHFAREGREVRSRHEAAQLAEDDFQAAGVMSADLASNISLLSIILLRDEPILFLECARQRNDEVPFPVRRLENVDRPGSSFLNLRQNGSLSSRDRSLPGTMASRLRPRSITTSCGLTEMTVPSRISPRCGMS